MTLSSPVPTAASFALDLRNPDLAEPARRRRGGAPELFPADRSCGYRTLGQQHVDRRLGKTVGNAASVRRSGIGVRADGTSVVACNPALSVATLPSALQAAGVQNAMELDINKG